MEQNSKIFKRNFKTKHPSTKIHYPNRLQTQTNQVLTNFHNLQISTSNYHKKKFVSSNLNSFQKPNNPNEHKLIS